MKINFAILFLLSISSAYSQIDQTLDIEKNKLSGQYRLTGFVHTADTGTVEFWAVQRSKDKKLIKDKSRKSVIEPYSRDWKKIVRTGTIKANAVTLRIGIWAMRTINDYYLDNITLEINEHGAWKKVEIENGDFEVSAGKAQKVEGWQSTEGYTALIDQSIKQSGQQSIHFTKQELLKYGNFKEHGAVAKVNGINIYFEVYGSGEPLLLLHGNNESIASFRYQIDELRKNYKVIAVDSRGQGKSSMDKKKMTYELMASDMNELLNELKLDSLNILGWSDGGNTGLVMAMKYPGKVKKLVTMGANLYPNKGAVQKKFMRDYRWTIRLVRVLAIAKPSKWKTKLKVGKMVLKEPRINPNELNKINCQVLVLAGEKDVVNETHTKLIAANIKNSKLTILKNLTHYAPQEDPSYFNGEVINFMNTAADKLGQNSY